MDFEKLIQLVRENDILYNYNHKNYHDVQKKDAIWRFIGKKMNQSGKDCKKQWTALRDSFRRNLKKRKLNDGQTPYAKKWKFEDEMSFVQPFVKERTFLPSQDILSDDDSMTGADLDEPMLQASEANEDNKNFTTGHIIATTSDEGNNISDTVIKYFLDSKRDEIETLFYSSAQTVKRMNPYYQALAKARVCSAISELELEHLTHETNTGNTYNSSNSVPSSAVISFSNVNVSTSEASPQPSSSQNTSSHITTEIVDVKPF